MNVRQLGYVQCNFPIYKSVAPSTFFHIPQSDLRLDQTVWQMLCLMHYASPECAYQSAISRKSSVG